MRDMQCFQVPMWTVFDAIDSRKFSGGRPYVGDPELQQQWHRLPRDEEKTLALSHAGLVLDKAMVFSALKRSHDRTAWILRFFNPAGKNVVIEKPDVDAMILEMDERADGRPWTAVVGAKKIVTLRFN